MLSGRFYSQGVDYTSVQTPRFSLPLFLYPKESRLSVTNVTFFPVFQEAFKFISSVIANKGLFPILSVRLRGIIPDHVNQKTEYNLRSRDYFPHIFRARRESIFLL